MERSGEAATTRKNPRVSIQTELGEIRIEIYEQQAPITASNFLQYVDGKRYDKATLYRVVRMDNQQPHEVKIAVIQGGLRYSPEVEKLPAIEHETTQKTGILHRDGTLSMGRGAAGTAASEFFICVGDQPELDFGGKRNPDGLGFAAFGRVTGGMDVVRRAHALPAEGQTLKPSLPIHSIRRVESLP